MGFRDVVDFNFALLTKWLGGWLKNQMHGGPEYSKEYISQGKFFGMLEEAQTHHGFGTAFWKAENM